MNFSHLHVHTQFSLLDGAAGIPALYKKATADKMRAIAITDHGNMFGAFRFVAEAAKYNTKENPNTIKPIVGCEFYLVADRHKKQFTKDDKDQRYHQLFLAKNAEGYKNLIKLCSLGYMDGLYGKYPRIDKELVLKYHKGLIATTCCIAAEVPRTILRKGEAAGEEVFKWWLDLFGEDYYIELQRHDIPEQNQVNEVYLRWAEKYNVKIIASNDSHYVDQENYNAHDILLCINTGEKQSTQKIKDVADDDVQAKDKRFAFYNDQFYFKTTDEMTALFSDVPQAIDNTNEIVDKIATLNLTQDILLPHFKVPDGYSQDTTGMDAYLKHLTYEGAKNRYKDIDAELEKRINFELFTIQSMGFAGYFLIVADFIKEGRSMGVFVGPGRGSAAGSVVAYCIGITNIDPIKYNLLFERFLNPDRKSMPDIDTDFDDEGRQKVIDYVVQKYGKNQVAQIVTYGTMAAKMSIKDVARVLDLPLSEANTLAKLVPERPGIELARLIKAPMDGENSLRAKEGLSTEEIEDVKKLRKIYEGVDIQGKVLKEAVVLEGSVRGTGIHAAGIIIAPKDLTEIIPVATSKDTDLLITQFDGKVIENVGVIKMDFLGLKTLTIIRDALILIEQNHGIKIDIDNIPLEDKKTFELYQRAETNGTFQFESAGMQKYLKELKPDEFNDLIAMNALFRPGPMEYIPDYINRKHGRQKIQYDLPEMEEHLKDTYGVTVYQEQVMLLSQKLAGFTKGDADVLRKAMGKKDKKTLDKMKGKFIEGTEKNGFKKDICEKIWTDWESFAQYAFNKSHSTCYAFVAFQTGYLKAHYPAEFMAATLTHNLSNIDKITFFMEECKRMGMSVLGPDINESDYKFSVNKKGQIRFGLGAVKGVGEGAVQAIVDERKNNGAFKNIFDVVRRVNLRSASKKTFESLAYAGGFDSFAEMHRAQYFIADKESSMVMEKLIRYGAAHQESKNSSQHSLFGGTSGVDMPQPAVPQSEPWSNLEKLKNEREVIGFYISGHPLDNYKFELKHFCPNKVIDIKEVDKNKGRELTVGAMISSSNHRISKMGKPFGSFTIEDYNDSTELVLFGEDYLKFKQFLEPGYFVQLRGKLQPRYKQEDQVEFRVNFIQLLSELREKGLRTITLTMSLNNMNEPFINKLMDIVKQKSNLYSSCTLKFNIVDKENNVSLSVPSKKFRIHPDNDFMQMIEGLQEVEEMKINEA